MLMKQRKELGTVQLVVVHTEADSSWDPARPLALGACVPCQAGFPVVR